MRPAPAPYSSAARSSPLLRAARPLRAGRQPAGAAQAAGGARAGSGRGGGKRGAAARRPREVEQRTDVTFRVPGGAPRLFKSLTQEDLSDFLQLRGADGFDVGDGKLSRQLEDLPEGGTVDLVLPKVPPLDTQVANLQQLLDNDGIAKEQQVAAFVQQVAAAEHPGSSVTMLPTGPFKGRSQEDLVQLDAAAVVDKTLYLAEHNRVLGGDAVLDMHRKVARIRRALTDGSSPDLAAALQGVTHARLFLAGEAVRAGLGVQELVDAAADLGMGVVLPSGQALGVVGAAPPVRL